MSVTPPERVVVLGGGIGGVATCAALRGGGYEGELLLIDSGEFPYDRPPLSKAFLAGEKDENALALQPPEWYDTHRVELVNRTRVLGIDARTLTARTDHGDVTGDRIVIATGGRAARPPIPGADDPRVHVLRDVEDAQRLRDDVRDGARALVVGAGLIGAEVSSTLVDLGASVTLVDAVDLPLASVVGDELAAWMHGHHGDRGIEVRAAGVDGLEATDDGVVATFSDGSDPITVDLVILGVGMVPSDELAREAGLDVDRGIIVDEHQQTSHPHVYAVGDVARGRGADGAMLPRAEHWEAAQHDAARVAAHLLGHAPPVAGAPWFWTDRHSHHIEVVGTFAGNPELVWRGSPEQAPFAVFAVDGARVVGAFAVDDTKVLRAARRLIDRGVPADRVALADPDVDARKLLKG